MVNTNIQGAIPLLGSGFVARRSGDFQPGEYKRLSNMEILESRLVNRRSVHSVYGDNTGTATTPIDRPFGFIGNLNDFAIMVNNTEQWAMNGNSKVAMWPVTTVAVPAAAGSFVKLIGYFRYNYKNYWLIVRFDAGTDVKFQLIHKDISATSDIPATYDAAYLATATTTTILTIPVGDTSFPKLAFRNFFMMNDRLWLVLSTGVYFSKATDPTVFAVPDGGFFKFPDQIINWAMGVNKSVYVLCDNQVSAITYSVDPNTDAYVRLLSDNVGGDHGTIFQDTPYFINQRGIFLVSNSNVAKFMDNEFDVGEDYYANNLTAFEDYLIVNKFIKENYEKFDPSVTSVRTNLVPNPSLTTNNNHYGGSDLYILRTRDNADHWSGGAAAHSHKVEKTNDKTVANRTNWCVNGDFDVDLAGWIPHSSASGGASVSQFARVADDGGSCKGSLTVSDIFQLASTDILAGNQPCAPGDDLEITADLKFNSSGSALVSRRLGVQWYDAGNNLISEVSEPVAGGNGAYVRERKVFTAPALTATCRVFVVMDVATGSLPRVGTFTMWVDKVKVEINPPTDNYPFFDGGTADTAEYDYQWTGAANASTSRQMGYAPVTAYYKAVDGTVDYIAVASNLSYTFGFAHKKQTAPSESVVNILLKIKQYDAGNNLLSDTDIAITHDTTAEPGWAFKTGAFSTSSTCTKIKFEIYLTHADFLYGQIDRFDGYHLETTSTYNGYFDGDTVDSASITYAWTGVANDSSSTATITQFFRKEYKNGRRWIPFLEGNSLGHNVFFVNMENGSVHVFDYNDGRNAGEKGYPVEFWVNTNKDSRGNYNCFFLANKFVSEAASDLDLDGQVYYLNSFKDTEFFDYAVDSANVLKKYPPSVLVEIDSYVPDGSEYQMKKFRNLELMARLPEFDFKLAPGYYNNDYIAGVDVSAAYNGSGRPHYPLRVGLNQRARALSLKLYNETSNVANENDYGQIEISDIRTIWTYTGRGPTVKAASSVN